VAEYNSLRPKIKLKTEMSQVQVEFLDLVIIKDMRVEGEMVPLYVRTHQKVMNKYLYLPFSSHHPFHVFYGMIKGELIRYVKTNTYEEDYFAIADKFKHRIAARGFPEQLFYKCLGEVKHSDRQQYLCKKVRPKKHEQSCISLFTQYTQLYASKKVNIRAELRKVVEKHSQSESIRKLFPEGRVPVVFTKGRSLGQLLVSSKHGHDC
jgi:hypothetical protein